MRWQLVFLERGRKSCKWSSRAETTARIQQWANIPRRQKSGDKKTDFQVPFHNPTCKLKFNCRIPQIRNCQLRADSRSWAGWKDPPASCRARGPAITPRFVFKLADHNMMITTSINRTSGSPSPWAQRTSWCPRCTGGAGCSPDFPTSRSSAPRTRRSR